MKKKMLKDVRNVRKRALGILADANIGGIIGPNSQKTLKLNIPDFPFLEQNETDPTNKCKTDLGSLFLSFLYMM